MADAFEDETEHALTIDEYIEEVEAQELEADLVLGGDDGTECTYKNGYMKRQAVFSCLTCAPNGDAGVCTACCLTCHDGHEIIELWTKRRFRCDCGSSLKFPNFSCKLSPEKDAQNSDNKYNQNFKGVYCTCGRPYPDPAVQDDDAEMIQCCVCEDWFHEHHLGLDELYEVPRDEEGTPLYEDFICQKCAKVFYFLKLYPSSIKCLPNPKNGPETTENNPNPNPNPNSNSNSNSSKGKEPMNEEIQNSKCNHQNANSPNPNPNGNSSSNSNSSKGKEPMNEEIQNQILKCKLEKDINSISNLEDNIGPLFLLNKWREMLCKCETCVGFYAKNQIEYLIDKEDTIAEYEIMAQKKRQEKLQKQEGAQMNFLNNMGHVQKIEMLSGISDFKDEFRNFLESFDNSRPINSNDVRGIFENLKKKKKQRLL